MGLNKSSPDVISTEDVTKYGLLYFGLTFLPVK